MQTQGILARYPSFLPLTEKTPALTLGEGGTPLLHARHLSRELGVDLFLKIEGANPTGSFKDRGMVVAVAKAMEAGKTSVICASTGNTSASAAAYAAHAGLEAVVVIPEGKVALGKLAQAIIYGARVLAIQGNFDEALQLVRSLADEGHFALVNSVNPDRLEGQKTGAFEIVDDLGRSPDILAIPVGNAGNVSAYGMGFEAYKAAGQAASVPKLFGFQAEGASPIVKGAPVAHPETVATAIRIGNPASWTKATAAVERSGGLFASVSDEEILQSQRALAQVEGVFAEPASAAAIAGLFRLQREGRLPQGTTVVAVLTGNGLKDPETAMRAIGEGVLLPVPASLEAVKEAVSG